ncbi:hypothetical protein PG991_003327 [Apiospora marii]|uniref:Uncharacterized protein n=1 Tax=Apiospora marii TaxID=335849 RepID=A0ABR1SHX0_9PEZI
MGRFPVGGLEFLYGSGLIIIVVHSHVGAGVDFVGEIFPAGCSHARGVGVKRSEVERVAAEADASHFFRDLLASEDKRLVNATTVGADELQGLRIALVAAIDGGIECAGAHVLACVKE